MLSNLNLIKSVEKVILPIENGVKREESLVSSVIVVQRSGMNWSAFLKSLSSEETNFSLVLNHETSLRDSFTSVECIRWD